MISLTDIDIKSLFILYLLISGNYLGELFSCDIQKFFSENIYIKHILGIMTLYHFVLYADPNTDHSILYQILNTTLLYGWFILTTKSSIKFSLVSIFSMFAIFTIKTLIKKNKKEKNSNLKRIEEIKILLKNSKDIDKKNKIIEINQKIVDGKKYDQIISHLTFISNTLFIILIASTILGLLTHIGEKHEEFGNRWNWKTFFLGKTVCDFDKMNNGKTDWQYISKALKFIFKK